MPYSQFRLFGAALAAALVTAATARIGAAQAPSTPPNTPPPLSTLRGAYTEAQATRGESAYRANCTSCHTTSGFVGDAFVRAWDGRTAFDLFELIRTTMPIDNPGRLSREQYAEIVAYMFKLNRLPSGDRPLPVDDEGLKHVRIETKPAPAP